ncbi:unnamed protein product [Allacma fusca]|uniref:KA1 domain-containing protein n=1 Tax=Allacma fusca TaxID=39272 RepID=A0A8J2KDX1_9HEXA|nr:unnamed protein product [Allacma fusca]
MEVDEDIPSEQVCGNCTPALEAEKKRACEQLIVAQENARLLLIVETPMNLLYFQMVHPVREFQLQMLRFEVHSLKLEKERLGEELVAVRNQVGMQNSRVDTISYRIAELEHRVLRHLQLINSTTKNDDFCEPLYRLDFLAVSSI